jgi:predicted O-methyltransferase YrrM
VSGEGLVDVIATKPGVETFQTPFELEVMLTLFDRKQPERVLEIGSWQGGTLWHWLQTADVVVAVDDQMRLAAQWYEWALDAGSTLELLHGSSQDPDIIDKARSFGPYDWVLIDADHTYGAVKNDWENYRGMVASGGIVLFHDILPRPDYGVDQVWAEVKAELGAQTVEIVETSTPDDPRWGGLGCIWMP